MKKSTFFFLIFGFSACFKPSVEIIKLDADKDLIPEGIAIGAEQIFISSIHKNKIVQYNPKTQETTDFITSNQYGFKSGVGLFLKDNLLFALTNDLHPDSLTSALFVFDIPTKKLLKTFELHDNSKHFLNDLAISNTHQIFITDTRQGKIYTLNYPNGNFETYLSDSTISYPNGIALSENGKKLFVASDNKGLKIIDTEMKKIVNKPSDETKGLDGIKFYNGKIYAIRNNDKSIAEHKILSISLTENEAEITKTETIVKAHPLMNVPTTLGISDGFIYCIANSQMDNLQQNTNKIIEPNALTDTYILKLKIRDKY